MLGVQREEDRPRLWAIRRISPAAARPINPGMETSRMTMSGLNRWPAGRPRGRPRPRRRLQIPLGPGWLASVAVLPCDRPPSGSAVAWPIAPTHFSSIVLEGRTLHLNQLNRPIRLNRPGHMFLVNLTGFKCAAAVMDRVTDVLASQPRHIAVCERIQNERAPSFLCGSVLVHFFFFTSGVLQLCSRSFSIRTRPAVS